MKQRVLSAVAAVGVLCLFDSPCMAQSTEEWTAIKGPKALSALYSNKTFRGKDGWGQDWIGYYRADGTGLLVSSGLRHPRTWKVGGGDEVCVTEARGTNCFTFERRHGERNRVRARHTAQGWYLHFTVEDGVPKF